VSGRLSLRFNRLKPFALVKAIKKPAKKQTKGT
jgi:hypothetical protein